MRRRDFLLAAGALGAPLPLRAQSAAPRVGVIYVSDIYAPFVTGMRSSLKEVGLQEGRNVVLDVRNARGNPKSVEEAAREFEREKVALIYCVPTTTTRIVQRVTKSIAIVFSVGSDPIALGFVTSYAKPGARMTGVHYLNTDLTAKRLGLLKDLLPKMSRVITFFDPDNPAAQSSLRQAREAAKKLGLQIVERHVRSEAELHAAVANLKHGDADAIFSVS